MSVVLWLKRVRLGVRLKGVEKGNGGEVGWFVEGVGKKTAISRWFQQLGHLILNQFKTFPD